MKKIIKAIILDFDGVLVNSEYHWYKFEFTFLSDKIAGWDEKKHERLLGMSLSNLYSFLKEKYTLGITKSRFFAEYNKMAREIYTKRVRLYPGMLNLIKKSKRAGFKLCLCTSSPKRWVNWTFRKFNLGHHFDCIVTAEDVKNVGKPSPRPYNKALKKLKAEPSECLAIEDSKNGVASAKSAGVYCIAFRNGTNAGQDLNKADTIVNSFAKVSRLLIK